MFKISHYPIIIRINIRRSIQILLIYITYFSIVRTLSRYVFYEGSFRNKRKDNDFSKGLLLQRYSLRGNDSLVTMSLLQ